MALHRFPTAGLATQKRQRAAAVQDLAGFWPLLFEAPNFDSDRTDSRHDYQPADAEIGAPKISATRNPGVGQVFTALAAAVQLRLRVRGPCGRPP